MDCFFVEVVVVIYLIGDVVDGVVVEGFEEMY